MALNLEKIQKVLDIVPLFVEMDLPKVEADYDREADVLYLNFEPGRKATDSEYFEEGIVVRYGDGKIIGITVLNASRFKVKPRIETA